MAGIAPTSSLLRGAGCWLAAGCWLLLLGAGHWLVGVGRSALSRDMSDSSYLGGVGHIGAWRRGRREHLCREGFSWVSGKICSRHNYFRLPPILGESGGFSLPHSPWGVLSFLSATLSRESRAFFSCHDLPGESGVFVLFVSVTPAVF